MNKQIQSGADDEINLLEVAIALGQQKKVLFGIPAATTAVALAYALFAPPIYTATTIILPPQQEQSSASSMLASLGSLAGLAGASAGIKSPEEMYVAFFNSQSVENDVINSLHLKAHYRRNSLYETRKELERNISVSADKQTGLIKLDASDRNPVFAATLANADVDALRSLLSRIAVTGAQQRRAFFYQQMHKAAQALAAADARFRRLSAQGGLPLTEALAQSDVQTSTALRAKITATELEIAGLQQFSTAQNPSVRRLTAQLTALREQLNRLQEGGARERPTNSKGEAAISALRDLKTQESVLEAMTKQYEMAKVDEAREGPLLQQVDVARPPERANKPKRVVIVIIGATIGIILGIIGALSRHLVIKIAQDPTNGPDISALREAWKRK